MAYGLKVTDPKGQQMLGGGDSITRLVYSSFEARGTSDSVVLPDIAGLKTLHLGLGIGGGGSTFEVTRSGTTISWTIGVYYDALIVVFLYS